MFDFRLPEGAWERAAKELRSPTPLTDRMAVEFHCGRYVCARRHGKKSHPKPSEYAAAWRAVASVSNALQAAIANLKEAGAAEIQFIDLFPGGFDTLKALERLPHLSEMASVVAEIEAQGRRVPAAADPQRDALARALIGIWLGAGRGSGAALGGPASRFLAATYSEAIYAAGEDCPTMQALRDVLRKHGKLKSQ